MENLPPFDYPIEAILVEKKHTENGVIGKVSHNNVLFETSLDLVPDATPGDRLLIVNRVAIQILKDDEDAVH